MISHCHKCGKNQDFDFSGSGGKCSICGYEWCDWRGIDGQGCKRKLIEVI